MSCNLLDSSEHIRTIIHIDVDCFYAQVEMLKKPELRTKPLGIQQKNIVVTSNYIAREFGVKKCMLISEALKLCPNLVLANGEDLYDYRQMSTKIALCIQRFTSCVEKLGFDENFLDITDVVQNRLQNFTGRLEAVGNVYGSEKESCICGCVQRLNMGSIIAEEIRKCIKQELGLTCCAGIASNKLLAKVGGARNKPDQQTIVYPSNASILIGSLANLRCIPGIGQNTYEIFKSADMTTIEDLRQCPFEKLVELFGQEKAKYYLDLAFGVDASAVKLSGRPQSIGLEDSCKVISIEDEVHEKFLQLLRRLMILVCEDGRVPRTLRVTLRKFDKTRKSSHREQRQCNISPTYFSFREKIQLNRDCEHKIMSCIMRLFHKMVDIKKPFHLTLFGLAFTKFQERQTGKNSIASFLMKNVSVHSVTSVQSTSDCSAINMDHTPVISNDISTDGSESEIEPSPKKCKLTKLIAKRRCLDSESIASPSKLRVAELRLNSKEMDRPPSDARDNYPDNVDPAVFKELPLDVQNELIQQWNIDKQSRTSIPKPKTNTLLNYLIKNK